MKYFQQDREGNLKEVKFRDLVGQKLERDLKHIKSIEVDVDSHTDKSGSWIEIQRKMDNKMISVVLSFDNIGNEIDDVNVYSTPIEKVVNHDETKRLT